MSLAKIQKIDRMPVDLLRTPNFNLEYVQDMDGVLELITTKSGIMVDLSSFTVYFQYSNNETSELIISETIIPGKITIELPAEKLHQSGRYKFQVIAQSQTKTQQLARGQMLVRAFGTQV